jgi:hypothetical protein
MIRIPEYVERRRALLGETLTPVFDKVDANGGNGHASPAAARRRRAR